MTKAHLSPVLKELTPASDPAELAVLATKQGAAICAVCSMPHRPIFDDKPKRCTQGVGCAAAFRPDGRYGYGHYGSIHDGTLVAVRSTRWAQFAGVDPVCDACLGSMALNNELWIVGDAGSLPGTLPTTDSEGLSGARDFAMDLWRMIATGPNR